MTNTHEHETGQPQIFIYENSYRMEPEPDEKFSQTQVEYALRPLIEKELAEVQYDPKTAIQLTKDMNAKVLEHLKKMNYPRYKFVVQSVIVQNSGQGIRVASRCLWHKKYDNYATVSYKNVLVSQLFSL